MQWVHRVLGTVLLLSAIVFFVRVRRVAPDLQTYRLCAALPVLMATQYLLGVLTLVYHVPVPLAAGHQALALVLVVVWIAALHHVSSLDVVPARHAQRTSSRRRAVA